MNTWEIVDFEGWEVIDTPRKHESDTDEDDMLQYLYREVFSEYGNGELASQGIVRWSSDIMHPSEYYRTAKPLFSNPKPHNYCNTRTHRLYSTFSEARPSIYNCYALLNDSTSSEEDPSDEYKSANSRPNID